MHNAMLTCAMPETVTVVRRLHGLTGINGDHLLSLRFLFGLVHSYQQLGTTKKNRKVGYRV